MPKDKAVTGIGITTRVAMESADLGIMRWDEQRGAIAAMFGDNFEFWRMQGEWQSPSIVMYDKDLNVLGVPTKDGIDPNGRRKQCWPYPHNNLDFSTILPCDFIRVGNWWYVAAMVTAGLGHEKRTVFWKSRDLYDWQKTDPYVSLVHNEDSHPGTVMLTFDQKDDYVYIFGTGGLARNRPIWLWRCEVDKFPYKEHWEPWGHNSVQNGWNWNVPNDHTPILPGRYGELCFRIIQGHCVLSYFDAENYRQTCLTTPNPTDNWSIANVVHYAFGQNFPQLYGGYIVPGSVLNQPNGMKFLVSQWNTANNDPYHVIMFKDWLDAKGPIIIEPLKPPAKPPPKPPLKPPLKPPEEKPMPAPLKPLEEKSMPNVPTVVTTPQQLYELLLRELSASGSVKITTPDGDNITLREAIEQIFYKERGLHGLEGGRPRHPAFKDDQLGHVLSMRAEGLINQALLVSIADHLKLNVADVFEQVQESLE